MMFVAKINLNLEILLFLLMPEIFWLKVALFFRFLET